MTRPVPETGQFETTVVDLAVWKRRALSPQSPDGTEISHEEAKELLVITNQLAKTGNRIVRTVSFVIRCLTGARGMDSVAVKRQWDLRQAELVYLDDYRDLEPGGPQAA